MKKKTVLLDELIAKNKNKGTTCCIDGKWYIARPLPYYSFKSTFYRFYHAWLVLRGKAHVYQYAEDYFKN